MKSANMERPLFFKYCTYSKTMRLWPYNYCILINKGNDTNVINEWRVDMDLAVPHDLAIRIFGTMHHYDSVYCTPEDLTTKLNLLL